MDQAIASFELEQGVTMRPLTDGKKFAWFGYYDKLQMDPTGRFALCMKVDFEGRSPIASEKIEVGMVDMQNGDEWIHLGYTSAWCWQQGCMLQWLPGSHDWIVWNERRGHGFVSILKNVLNGDEQEVPMPIYTLAPDGKTALAPDFRRINDTRPGYGYCGHADPAADELCPDSSGIWKIDLETGQSELIITLKQIQSIPGSDDRAKHWFNHLLVNPDGTRFTWLHRWKSPDVGRGGFSTRMLTADLNGQDIRIVDPSGHTSHFDWKDPHHILAYTKPVGESFRFFLIDERDGSYTLELDDPNNGHCLYLPDRQVFVNDTYPMGGERKQHLYLYDPISNERRKLGWFHAPEAYAGEWRCDLHARVSPDGSFLTIDSAHEGGRNLYRLDI